MAVVGRRKIDSFGEIIGRLAVKPGIEFDHEMADVDASFLRKMRVDFSAITLARSNRDCSASGYLASDMLATRQRKDVSWLNKK